MKIKELIKPRTVFHCKTEEEANELLRKAHELGYKWAGGTSYLNRNDWDSYKEYTCYDICHGQYSSIKYYKDKNYKIIEYILDKELEEKSMGKIIDGKDLANMKFIKDSEGRLIVHKPLGTFTPKMNEYYYYINECDNVVCDIWANHPHDKWRLKHYKLFRTEEECKDYKWFLEQVDEYSYEFSQDEWKDTTQEKFTIEFNFEQDDIIIEGWLFTRISTRILFKERKICKQFISVVGKERIKKYIFDICY